MKMIIYEYLSELLKAGAISQTDLGAIMDMSSICGICRAGIAPWAGKRRGG